MSDDLTRTDQSGHVRFYAPNITEPVIDIWPDSEPGWFNYQVVCGDYNIGDLVQGTLDSTIEKAKDVYIKLKGGA